MLYAKYDVATERGVLCANKMDFAKRDSEMEG